MTEIVQSLFGLSPYDVQQQRQQATNTQANAYAQLDPFQRATQSLYQAGAGFGRVGAGMLGMVDPKEQEAQQMQQLAQSGDFNNPEGLRAFAKTLRDAGRVGDSMRFDIAAQQMEAQSIKNRQEQAQTALYEAQTVDLPRQKHEEALARLEIQKQGLLNQQEIARQRSEDTRLSIEARSRAAEEANQIKLQIAEMTAGTKNAVYDAKKEAAQAKIDEKNQAKEEGKASFGQSLDELAAYYKQLDELGGIVNTDNSGLSNAISRAASSGIGQFTGGTFGTKEQELRDKIQGTIPLLVLDIKNITGASAQQMNSNVELQNFMRAASNPKTSVQTALKLLDNLKRKYKINGQVATDLGQSVEPAAEFDLSTPAKINLLKRDIAVLKRTNPQEAALVQQAMDAQLNSSQAPSSKPVQIRGNEDYAKLPPGTVYIDPNGKQRVKQ